MTPTVIEKQNATMARYSGDRWNRALLCRFKISSREKPMAAHKKAVQRVQHRVPVGEGDVVRADLAQNFAA